MTFDVNQNAQTDNNIQVRKPLEVLHAATCATLSAKRPPEIVTSIKNNAVNSSSNPSLSSNNNKLPIFLIELPYEQISSLELGEFEKSSLLIITNAVNNSFHYTYYLSIRHCYINRYHTWFKSNIYIRIIFLFRHSYRIWNCLFIFTYMPSYSIVKR